MAFIHTFCLRVEIDDAQKGALINNYKKEMKWIGDEKKHMLSRFVNEGVRLEIRRRHKEEERYDKKHRRWKVFVIVTLYKLLHPRCAMGMVVDEGLMARSCSRLLEILREVKEHTGVDLWDGAKLSKVDVTEDVHTPNGDYAKEIIRLAKKVLLPYGCRAWIPNDEDVERTGWPEESSMMFYNHKQDIKAKIYNKGDCATIGDNDMEEGRLVRFELSLMRGYIRRNGYVKKCIKNGEGIFFKHWPLSHIQQI